jgi:hypothetical protein
VEFAHAVESHLRKNSEIWNRFLAVDRIGRLGTHEVFLGVLGAVDTSYSRRYVRLKLLNFKVFLCLNFDDLLNLIG